jgi:zinc protease
MKNRNNFQLAGAAKEIFLLLLIALSCSSTSFGQATPPGAAPAAAPTATTAKANDTTTDFVTANGLKTIHRQVQGNDVVAVQVYFRGGSRNINDKNAGIETLMLEVAQQGTKSFTKSQINRELARMGTVVDSLGGYDFSVIAMKCVRQNFDRSWQLLTDIILNPLFDEREVVLVKDQLLNGLRQQNDVPEAQVALLSNKMLFAAHPYTNPPDGTIDSVSKLTATDLKAHHADMLWTSRMLVVVVGNVTGEEAKRKIETSFGALPNGNYKNEAPGDFARAKTPEFQLVEKGVATNYIRGTFAAPPLDHPDYPAFAVAINILQQLFFQEVRVKRQLTYGADATLLSNRANSAYISVTTPKPNEALKVMFDQVDFLKKQIILREPLKIIVSGFLTQYYTKLETNDAQAARLAEYELLGSGWRRLLTWFDEVNKVTPEDIQRVCNTYLKNFHFAAIGNANQFDKELFMSK